MTSDRRKVLLMGRAGAGKTSMRSIIFANYLPRDTSRLTATNNIEHSHLRFFGNLVLSLWDCGGQDIFMENYFESQREHIFRSTEVMIYVLEVRKINQSSSKQIMKDLEQDFLYFRNTINNLKALSPEARLFCLIHKMDILSIYERETVLQYYENEISKFSNQLSYRIFPTTIWDETLFAAWSEIVYALIPNVELLEKNLQILANVCNAQELVIFEKSTFLVISHASNSSLSIEDKTRFERISNICKQFKLTCAKSQTSFIGLSLHTPKFSSYIERFTQNSYILVVIKGIDTTPSATLYNIDYARDHFEAIIASHLDIDSTG
ncbi:GTP-binding protein Rag A, putative [Cryptosporidium muris RN66]|uniref:GTP-binding protein Rag A, putative n=1 Tax=Cryptosporidium muris (strain RN66) TaxID=441375 RepID=B6ADC2_CRYMR|nr:GTP-binding protein Rag A, putative [Cryptosporidium muris RN66]EEA06213.1 GTP-binding protein Rag A, putative [Cryptosporidium muris RN66]|eukprot:XP_002140562.1 GTP-binding protein Rag A [Cryptosporidium muris RN66]